MVTQVFNRARVRGLAARNPAADVKPGCLVKQPLRPCSLSPCSLNQANFLTRVPNLGKGARTGEPFLDVRPRSRRSHRCGEYGLPADEAVSMAGAKLESGGVTLEREATLKCLLTGGLVWALLLQVPGEAGGMVPLVPLAGPANSPEATHLRPRNQKCRASRLASLLHKIGPQVRFCVPRERTRFLLLRSLGEARREAAFDPSHRMLTRSGASPAAQPLSCCGPFHETLPGHEFASANRMELWLALHLGVRRGRRPLCLPCSCLHAAAAPRKTSLGQAGCGVQTRRAQRPNCAAQLSRSAERGALSEQVQTRTSRAAAVSPRQEGQAACHAHRRPAGCQACARPPQPPRSPWKRPPRSPRHVAVLVSQRRKHTRQPSSATDANSVTKQGGACPLRASERASMRAMLWWDMR